MSDQIQQDPNRGTAATKMAGLTQFAGEVFSNSQGKYTLDDYDYFDDTSLFSTAAFTVIAGAAAVGNTLTANASQDLFVQPVRSQGGQGFPATYQYGYAETNLQRGQANAKFPQNQSYVGVAGGFEVYIIPADDAGVLVSAGGVPTPNASDLFQILSSITWSWNVGGNQSPTIFYEPIKAWPNGFGVFGIGAAGTTQAATNGGPMSCMRRFAFPLMFPPNTAAQLTLNVSRNPSNFISLNANSLVCVAMHLHGYMLSKVR